MISAPVPVTRPDRSKRPADTRWEWVDGGNHSQFGWYGFQPGDRRATIDASIQRRLMIDAVLTLRTDARRPGQRPDIPLESRGSVTFTGRGR